MHLSVIDRAPKSLCPYNVPIAVMQHFMLFSHLVGTRGAESSQPIIVYASYDPLIH